MSGLLLALLIVVAIVLLVGLIVVAVQLPELRRYRKIRSM